MGSGKAFARSREFSAYLGLTPWQYSSGGKTNIVGISKKVGNRRLRSILIQGARAYVYRMKEPRSLKDRWLKDLIERAGPNRAAVALANKSVRTAWAMMTQGTDYQRRLQLEMAAWNVLQTENLASDKDICSGQTCTALRPSSPLTLRGTGVRIHRGPGDSVSN
jgi:hypothetical protein